MNLQTLRKLTTRVGFSNTLRLVAHQLKGKPADGMYSIRASGYEHPFFLRLHGSDPAVFKQVIRDGEYDILPPETDVELVIDCGANVGFTSVYFLNRFPKARLIAIEPDPSNFAVLQRNLAPYRDRVRLVNSGVWSHPARLRMSEEPFRDGREWARMVRECRPEEASEFVATDIGTLFRESGAKRISFLKIDVEKSEREIFARNYESWIHNVDAMAIELHDDDCRAVFERAIADAKVPLEFREMRELTVGVRRALSQN